VAKPPFYDSIEPNSDRNYFVRERKMKVVGKVAGNVLWYLFDRIFSAIVLGIVLAYILINVLHIV